MSTTTPNAAESSLTWIAEQRLVFVHGDGRRVNGLVAIASPVLEPETGVASCAVALDGMHDRLSAAAPMRIQGGGTLQALVLAVGFAGKMLRNFVDGGGRVLFPDEGTGEGDVDVPIDALFGTLDANDDESDAEA
jgi:hypothetical protein